MKKSLLIIMSVAILGGLGLYINNPKNVSGALATAPVSPAVSTSQSNSSSNTSPATPAAATSYKDGTYNGTTDTPYGTVQIAAVITGGKITDVEFLQMPSDQGYSRQVTAFAQPLLKQTALQHQNANIDFVSGATSTSDGFEQSLQQALDKAAS